MHLLFVYGTLLQGYPNHKRIEKAVFMGPATTVDNFTMFAHRGFPAITLKPLYPIKGELFALTDEELQSCDFLEGYDAQRVDNHYQRKQIAVECVRDGKPELWNAWIYYQLAKPFGMQELTHGDYAKFHNELED